MVNGVLFNFTHYRVSRIVFNGIKNRIRQSNRIMLKLGDVNKVSLVAMAIFIVIHVYYGYSYCRTNFAVIKKVRSELYSDLNKCLLVKC